MDTGPLEIKDFKGGFTDNYIDGRPDKFQKGENFLINGVNGVGKLSVRPGFTKFDHWDGKLPAVNRCGWADFFGDILFVNAVTKVYYSYPAGVGYAWLPLWNNASVPFFPTGASTYNIDANSMIHATRCMDHLLFYTDEYCYPKKVFNNYDGSTNPPSFASIGEPKVTAGQVTVTGSGAFNYLYKFVWKYSYKVISPDGTVTEYIVRGEPSDIIACTATAPTITRVSTPGTGSTAYENYYLFSHSLEVYRTTNGGSVFYYNQTINNGTPVSDTVTDANLILNELLYTEGGVLPNTAPPRCNVIHAIDGYAFYADILDDSTTPDTTLKSRILQAHDGAPWGVPATNYVDLEGQVMGMSDFRGVLLAMTSLGNTYRIDGRFDILGRGGMVAQRIAKGASCVSAKSVVQTKYGVFWAGSDGFYYSDAVSVVKITKDLPDSYAAIVSDTTKQKRIQGHYDTFNDRVYWTVQTGATDNDTFWVLDLNYGISEEMPFTTWVAGNDTFYPTAVTTYQGNVYFGDKRGYVWKFTNTTYDDPVYTASPTNSGSWTRQAIVYDYISCAYNFGTNFLRKWVTRISFQARYIVQSITKNLSLQLKSINDVGKSTLSLKEVRRRSDSNTFIEEQRRMPATGLRCSYKQIEVTNAYSNIINSDNYGLVNIDATGKTATLVSSGAYDWPTGMENYYIYFQNDGYVNPFKITSIGTDSLVYSDSGNLSVTASNQKFQIKGYPKQEAIELLNYTLEFAPIGETQKQYAKSDSGNLA